MIETKNIQDIASDITARKTTTGMTIIAIEGFGGSGKSTLAQKLNDLLHDAYVLSIDAFIIKEKISDPIKSNFDRDRLEQEVLLPIRNGTPVLYRELLWKTNTLSEPLMIPAVKYLILEGVSTFHPDIVDYMDYKIWIETPKNIAQERGSIRDANLGNNNDDLWDHWTTTYQEYKDLYHPEKIADCVYYNN